jgi:hypothetical protein
MQFHLISQRRSRFNAAETSCLEAGPASAARKPVTHPGKMIKLIDEHLEHLRETKDLFDHLHETKDLFDHLARSLPKIRKIGRRRNVTSPMRGRFAHGDWSLNRLFRTFFHVQHQPRDQGNLRGPVVAREWFLLGSLSWSKSSARAHLNCRRCPSGHHLEIG